MGPIQKKMGPARPLTSSTWPFKNNWLPLVPKAYQLVQILQTLVPNYSSLCLLSDFLMHDQPGSKDWGPEARTHSPHPHPQAVRRHKIPGWGSRWNRSSSRCSSKIWTVLRQ